MGAAPALQGFFENLQGSGFIEPRNSPNLQLRCGVCGDSAKILLCQTEITETERHTKRLDKAAQGNNSS